jgi:ornithine carbamoyltransferase
MVEKIGEKAKRVKKDLLTLLDIGSELESVIDFAIKLKTKGEDSKYQNALAKRTMAMIFEKSSTRTRVSFEVAMTQMSGHSMFLSPKDLQLGRGETVADTAKVLSRYVDIIMYRAFSHDTMKELAENATIPVINGLDDLAHPCQIIADLMTIKEHKGKLGGIDLAYVGDGNNVCNSLLLGTSLVGMNIRVGCPEKYSPNHELLNQAKDISKSTGSTITLTTDPKAAVKDCDVIYTDVWVSMGNETERTERESLFKPYQVNSELVKFAKNDCIIMHCLPAHRGLEITDEVIDSERAVVFDEAENRLHAQKAIILYLLGMMG